MADENNPNPLPEPPPVPSPNPQPPAPVQADPPPAAELVTNGEVTDERILAAQQAQRTAEFRAAELEAENQRLKEIPRPPIAAPAPVKKPKRWKFSPIIGADDDDDTAE
jgi:hypothetical protein